MLNEEQKLRLLKTLSPAEMRLAWWMCKGRNDAQLSSILNIAIGTINTQKAEIFKNLELTGYESAQRRSALIAEYKNTLFALIPTEDALKNYRPDPIIKAKQPTRMQSPENELRSDQTTQEEPAAVGQKTEESAANRQPSIPTRPVWSTPLLIGGFLVFLCMLAGVYGLQQLDIITFNNPLSSSPTISASTQAPTEFAEPTIANTEKVPALGAVDTSVAETLTAMVSPTSDIPIPTNTLRPTDIPEPTQTSRMWNVENELVDLGGGAVISLYDEFGNCGNNRDTFGIALTVKNNRDSEFMIRFNSAAFSAIDDKGNEYHLARPVAVWECTNSNPDVQYRLGGYRTTYIQLTFEPMFSIDASYILITANNISGVGPLIFAKDI